MDDEDKAASGVPVSYWFKQEEQNRRYPPRRRPDLPPSGQSFEELTAKHGRPNGPFDKERQLPYSAAEPS